MLQELEATPDGLSPAQAATRLREAGPNELPSAPPRSAWRILLDQLRSVIVLLLVAAAAISLASGDMIDALAIAAVLVINTTIGFTTELRARRAMQALLQLEVPRATIRRLPAVETLGAVTVVCTDKTGTLTMGEMTATTLWVAGQEYEISGEGYAPDGTIMADGSPVAMPLEEPIAMALRIAMLANRADVVEKDGRMQARGDPTEAALVVAAAKGGLEREALLAEAPEIGEVPFSSERQFMTTFHRASDGGIVALLKGAPSRC